jgi:acyl carrier protein
MDDIVLKEFIRNFSEQLEDINDAKINENTEFRTIEGWSSIVALFIIAMADNKYKVKLTGDDIRQSATVGDIYRIITSRSKS